MCCELWRRFELLYVFHCVTLDSECLFMPWGLLVEALKGAGYAVLSAARPEEAIRMSHRHPGQIALIVSDVVMPEMAGPKLVERIADEQLQMRVLYISGYADDEFVQRGLQERSINFLQKPFELPALLAIVRRVLDFTT